MARRIPTVNNPMIRVYYNWGSWGATAVLFPGGGAEPVELEQASANPADLRKLNLRVEQVAADHGGIPVCREGECTQCRGVFDDVMLTSEVWAQVWPHGEVGYLCIACIEANLGRPLRMDDLTHAPINRNVRLGFRMAETREEPNVTALGGTWKVDAALGAVERLRFLRERYGLPEDWMEMLAEVDRRLASSASEVSSIQGQRPENE